MKKLNYFKLFAFAICSCFMTSTYAQTLVGDSATLASNFATMKAGTGGVIQLTANITFRIKKSVTYSLTSTPTAPIEIDAQGF